MENSEQSPPRSILHSITSGVESLTRVAPAAVAVTYLAGFVVISAHLGSFRIYDSSLWDTWRFVAGCQTVGLLIPIFVFIHYAHPKPTDNFARSWKGTLLVVILTTFYGLLLCLVLFHPHNNVLLWSLLLFSGAQFWLTSYAAREIDQLTKAFLMLAPLLGAFVALAVAGEPYQISFVTGLVCLALLASGLYGEWGDGDLTTVRVVFHSLGLIAAAIGYGGVVYKHVDRQWGGGRAIEKRLLLDSELKAKLSDLPPSILASLEKPISVVHETDAKYFVAVSGEVVALDKSLFVGEITKIDQGSQPIPNRTDSPASP